MNNNHELASLTRRSLLKRCVAVSSSLALGNTFVAGSTAAWALETQSLEPHDMATLVQMARDIYPHDRFGDEIYAVAVKGYDEKAKTDPDQKKLITSGVADLDSLAAESGHSSYLSVGWEKDRVAMLESIESSRFFQTIRSGLVVGIYNQKAVWEILGYEGASFSKGGYLDRGFDDVNWL